MIKNATGHGGYLYYYNIIHIIFLITLYVFNITHTHKRAGDINYNYIIPAERAYRCYTITARG